MTSVRLTDTDREALAFLALADGEGLTLAHDVAVELGWNPRSAGQRLRRLVRLGLVEAAVAKPRASMRSDRLDGYRLTSKGRELAGEI